MNPEEPQSQGSDTPSFDAHLRASASPAATIALAIVVAIVVVWGFTMLQSASTIHLSLPVTVTTTHNDPTAIETPSITPVPHPSQNAGQHEYGLALAYLYGRGVPKDINRAFLYFQQSADAGNANALRDIGYIYMTGMDVPKDEAKGRKLITQAANFGSPVAQNDLGLWYGDGTGVKQDWVESYKWMKLSANQGYAQSVQDVEYCKQRMTAAQIAQAEALVAAWRPQPITKW